MPVTYLVWRILRPGQSGSKKKTKKKTVEYPVKPPQETVAPIPTVSSTITNRHIPHDDVDEPHDDLAEAVEEVHHGLCFLSHVAHNNTERTAERNDT